MSRKKFKNDDFNERINRDVISPTPRIPTLQAGIAPFLFNQTHLIAFRTNLRTVGCLDWYMRSEHTKRHHVRFDATTDLCDKARHIAATGFPMATAWIKYRTQFVDQKGNVITITENGRNDTGESNDPLEVLHIF